MKKKWKSLLVAPLLFGLLIVFFSSNTESTELIYWEEGTKLTWDDFAGKPNYAYKDISALTTSGIIHYMGCEDGKITYRLRSYFDKSQSWVKKEAYTDHHLRHEQVHFDITELYARKLRKELSEREFVCGQEKEFETFIDNFMVQWQSEQMNYDWHSQHSMKPAKQKIWRHRIAFELSVFDDYKYVDKEKPLK